MSGIKLRRRAFGVSSRRAFSRCTEPLEPRLLLATFTVINTGDTGAGSFRQAILDANAAAGADTINFNIPGGGVQTIKPLSALPAIAVGQPVTIDGYTEAGSSANTLAVGDNAILTLVIDGAATSSGAGLAIQADNSTVRGLVIGGFTGDGISIKASNTTIAGNFIGLGSDGATPVPNSAGVSVFSGSGNLVGGTTPDARNLISGNKSDGVFVQSDKNFIRGNYIGTDKSGTLAEPNFGGGGGVALFSTAAGNVIGGTASGAGNLISGNADDGIDLSLLPGGTGNLIQGNLIGTNATGTGAVGNGAEGVSINLGLGNTVGGTDPGAGNVISGNFSYGINILNNSNTVQGNYIGTNAAGDAAIPNGLDGIVVASTGNLIGGPTAAARNIISGNTGDGVVLSFDGNKVQGNYIGVNAAGAAAIANKVDGIAITTGTGNSIDGNVISGNSRDGVVLLGESNTVTGNFIGTDPTGKFDLGNERIGVRVQAKNNTVGGTIAAARNIISGNAWTGVDILAGEGVLVQGNYIGTDITGNSALPNDRGGVAVETAAGSTIGGTASGAGNLISGNHASGIFVGTGANLTIQGNLIGTNVAGTGDLGNDDAGVKILDGSGTIIIGLDPAAAADAHAANVISGNGGDGVSMSMNSHGVYVLGNFIGTDRSAKLDLGNAGSGVAIGETGYNNFIGSLAPGLGNTIAFNNRNGVTVTDATAVGNLISANSIFLNDLLGIDLGDNGVTSNDNKDPDTGPNDLQNWPVLKFATSVGGSTTISGSLNSLPGTPFQIQFFLSDSGDLSGNGEGKQFLGTVELTTNASGDLNFAKVFPFALAAGKVITATAINQTNNDTSEFSNGVNVSAPGPSVSISDVTKAEGNSGTTQFVFTVTLSSPSSDTITVDYNTQDGTAKSFADFPGDQVDYINQSSSLIFNPGQTSKTITINVNGDTTVEPDETFAVQLSRAFSSGFDSIPIDKAQGIGTIVNDDVVASGPAVTTFDLINADTGAVIKTISEGDTLNLATLPAHLAVRADTSPGTVGSVKFGYDQAAGSFNANYRVENLVPYALFADDTHGKFFSGVFTLGGHTLVATPFTSAGAKGTAGTAKTVHFTVIGSIGPSISSFTLVNADTDKDIMALTDGITLTLASLPTTHLSIRVNTSPSPTGSVKLGYDQVAGTFNPNFRIENLLPYALFGDDIPGNYNVGVLTAGNHTLTATPFTASAAKGTAGAATTIHFKVV